MNFRTTAKSSSIDIDLTPLINIVFLILIFFMLAGTLKPSESIQAAEMESASAMDDDLMVIVMTHDGQLRIDGQNIDRQDLNLILETKNRATGKIAIKPDYRLPAEQLLSLSEQLRTAGIAEVTLIVESR